MIKLPLAFPSVIQVRNRKCMFFIGDHWVEIGPVQYGPPVANDRGVLLGVPVRLPDTEAFFEERRYLDDGTDDWHEWGPRMN